jgi:NitT/TauT family transport system substrate-binding protein
VCGTDELDSLVPPLAVTPKLRLHMVSRRSMLRTVAKAAALAPVVACSPAPGAPAPTAAPANPEPAAQAAAPTAAAPAATVLETVELAFCSLVMCILPFEVARQRGFFAAEGLDVNLTYMRGGTQAMNALVAGSLDFVGNGFDLVVQTVAKGKQVLMVGTTSRLPFFAMVAGPQASGVRSVKDLAGKKIGVVNLGTTDQLLGQYVLVKEGVDPDSVEFVALGPNIYEQLVRGQVEAAMVQEPALTLTERAGGRVLVNFMRLDDSQRYLGGPYQFMGLHTRPDVLTTKAETARKLVRGLGKANRWILDNPGSAIVQAAPSELVAGGDVEVFAASLDRYKKDLYPPSPRISTEWVQVVIDVQQKSGALEAGKTIRPEDVFTNQYVTEA